MINNIDNLFDKAVGEIERMLNSKTVVGDPTDIESNTLIPLVNVGFGFGSDEGSEANKGSGHGGGTGGGGGVKPVALVIVNADGVRVEPIKSSTASVVEKVAEHRAGQSLPAKRSSPLRTPQRPDYADGLSHIDCNADIRFFSLAVAGD